MLKLIQGGLAKDHRGQIRFVNDFEMSIVKRFYLIKNNDLDVVRGWRGHRVENRWFFVISGAFILDVVEIDNWESPDRNLKVSTFTLESTSNMLLHVPPGFATAFRCDNINSELLVFADQNIEHSGQDDYTYDSNYFMNLKV